MRTVRERTDSYAEKGGHAIRQFFLSCIRSGNPSVLRSELQADLYRAGILQLFGDDLHAAETGMSFVCAQAWYVAVQAGVPEQTADHLFQTYSDQVHTAASLTQLLDAYAAFLISCAEAVSTRIRPQVSSAQIQTCIDYICAHIYRPLTVQQIASELGFNASYLSKSFKDAVGKTIISYIQEEKIRTAELLLSCSAMSIQEVMERLGYISQSHFTKLFREQTGLTPARYRSAAAEKRQQSAQSPASAYDRTILFQRLEEYGQSKGLEVQQYHLSLLRRGNAAALAAELQRPEYYAETSALMSGRLDFAIESFLVYWTNAMHTASESGLPVQTAVHLTGQYISKLYACISVGEALDLNRQFMIELANAINQD